MCIYVRMCIKIIQTNTLINSDAYTQAEKIILASFEIKQRMLLWGKFVVLHMELISFTMQDKKIVKVSF